LVVFHSSFDMPNVRSKFFTISGTSLFISSIEMCRPRQVLDPRPNYNFQSIAVAEGLYR
jgi:hypothetical protein